MTPLLILWLAVSGAIFALWAFQVFRCLFTLLHAARAQAASRGAMWPSPAEQLTQFAIFLRAPIHAQDRRRLLLLTALVLFTALIQLAVLPPR